MCAKKYENWMTVDKVIVKIIWPRFFGSPCMSSRAKKCFSTNCSWLKCRIWSRELFLLLAILLPCLWWIKFCVLCALCNGNDFSVEGSKSWTTYRLGKQKLVKNNQDNQIQSITLYSMYFRKGICSVQWGLHGTKPQKLGNIRECLC